MSMFKMAFKIYTICRNVSYECLNDQYLKNGTKYMLCKKRMSLYGYKIICTNSGQFIKFHFSTFVISVHNLGGKIQSNTLYKEVTKCAMSKYPKLYQYAK